MSENPPMKTGKRRKFWAKDVYPSEDYQIDPIDDAAKPFGRIHSSPQEFQKQMVEIASHSYPRTSSQLWTSRLRLLEAKRGSTTAQHESHSSQLMESSKSGGLDFDLNLCRRKESDAATDYVAVSYCWNRPGASWFAETGAHRTAIWKDGSIAWSPESDIVYRAARFALSHDCKNIWIDQYCIDQEDAIDKQEGIQAMDIVYQTAALPVAILESYIDTQEKMDAFASIFTGEMDGPDALEDLEQVLKLLVQDQWFDRAWTLQEAVSAGVFMRLLIGCGRALEKPEVFGHLPEEIEILVWDLQIAMVAAREWVEELLAAEVLEDDELAISVSNLADEIFNKLPERQQSELESTAVFRNEHMPSDRRSCTAAEAVNYIQERKNSIFSDRIDIIANLCNYSIRLDRQMVERNGYGFSTCVLTMAVLNGDCSLMGEYSDPWDRSFLSRDGTTYQDRVSNTISYGFSWGPTPYGALRNIEYLADRCAKLKLEPCNLSARGLEVRGVLWKVVDPIDLPELAEFRPRWKERMEHEQDPRNLINKKYTNPDPLASDFIASLLETLYKRGFVELTRAFWLTFRPQPKFTFRAGKDSTATMRYEFNQVFGPSAQMHIRQIEDHFRLSYVDPYYDPARSSMLRELMKEVVPSGKLPVARAISSSSTDSDSRVLDGQRLSNPVLAHFERSQPGNMFFSPWTDLGDNGRRWGGFDYQAVSWKVSQPLPGSNADEVAGVDSLQCHGEQRGFYKLDDLDDHLHNYILQ